MLLKYMDNILVQKMINLAQRAILQAFFDVVSNLSTELSTDSVDNKNHKKKAIISPESIGLSTIFAYFFSDWQLLCQCELLTHYCH